MRFSGYGLLIIFAGAILSAQADEEYSIEQLQQAITIADPVPAGEFEAVGRVGTNCTGTLIANDLVLTAAHCICSPAGCQQNATFTLTDVYPVDDANTPQDESLTRQHVSVTGRVRVHPDYENRGWLREDYATITLDRPVSESANVAAIPVAPPGDIPLPGETLTLVGFGDTGPACNSPGGVKQALALPVTTSNFDTIHFRSEGLVTCGGDSGGPILDNNSYVVGVASWTDSDENSYYRPTSAAYNWIFGLPRQQWSECNWVPVGARMSHQAGRPWCSTGSFLAALDLDGDRNINAHDAPVIGQALCCNLAGAENLGWGNCSWEKVGQKGINSHQPRPGWCPDGTFITQIDLDSDSRASANDSPVVGQVRCCSLPGRQYARWGSSYWMFVERAGVNSHQRVQPWCLSGAFMTQFDLDGSASHANHDAPIVGQVRCGRPRPEGQLSGPRLAGRYLMDGRGDRIIEIRHAHGIQYTIQEQTSPWPWKGTVTKDGSRFEGIAVGTGTNKARFTVTGQMRADGSIAVEYDFILNSGGEPHSGPAHQHVLDPS